MSILHVLCKKYSVVLAEKDYQIKMSGNSANLFYRRKEVGSVWVVEDMDPKGKPFGYIKETGIGDGEHRNKGFGKALYLKVLKNAEKKHLPLFKGKHSPDAERVWKSLEREGWILEKTGEKSPYRMYRIIKK